MTKTILICSSDEISREELKKILSVRYPLIVVEDADHCLAALKQSAPIALAFIGTATEGASPKIFQQARQAAPTLTIIAVGDSGSEEDAVAAVRQGATGYIVSPPNADDIHTLAAKHATA